MKRKLKVPKARNPIAKSLRSPHLAPKTEPIKKGKGSVYSRKGRKADGLSGPYYLVRGTLPAYIGI